MIKSPCLLLALALALAHASAAHAACSDPVRLMSFNIRLDTPADGDHAWQYRRAFLAGQIAFARPDILGLQEVVLNQKRDLQAALPGYMFLGVARDDGAERGEFSSLVIDRARFAVLSSGTFWLSPTPAVPSMGWDAGYRRVATWAHLRRRSDGTALLAINSHWDNSGTQARMHSAGLIRSWLRAHRRPGEALAVLGDFNAEPGAAELLQLAHGAPGDAPLTDTRTAPSIGSRGSFNDFVSQPAISRTIDHIFVDAGLHPLRHAVLSWTADGAVASDHFAVLADVRPVRGGGGLCRQPEAGL